MFTEAEAKISNAAILNGEYRRALELTYKAMERGEFQYFSLDGVPREAFIDIDVISNPVAFKGKFNIGCWRSPVQLESGECETICCIGGAAEILGNLVPGTLLDAAERDDELYKLFYPDIEYHSMNAPFDMVSVDMAKRALRSYLDTGKANYS